MSTTVNETCACGARFEFRGDYGMTAVGAFRRAHAECRRRWFSGESATAPAGTSRISSTPQTAGSGDPR